MQIRNVTLNIKRFHSSKKHPIVLPFPVSPALRVAQLSHTPKFAGVQPVVLKNWSEICVSAPNVVVGSAADLLRLGEQSAAGVIDISSIDHALVVITRYGAKPLTDLVRVTLWQTFGVPIFELYLGLDDSLLASECEAHDGWHVAPAVNFEFLDGGEMVLDGAGNTGLCTGLSASLDPNPCPCGRAEPHLLDMNQVWRADSQYLAVSA
jgi:hypothetical protein